MISKIVLSYAWKEIAKLYRLDPATIASDFVQGVIFKFYQNTWNVKTERMILFYCTTENNLQIVGDS